METYRSVRRNSIGMRGSVREGPTGAEVLQTRSKRLADVVTRLLNGDDVPRRRVEDPSPLARYSVSRGNRDGQPVNIFSALSTARNPSAFGDGIIGRAWNESLARRVVTLLNEIDPEPCRRYRRGFGWW